MTAVVLPGDAVPVASTSRQQDKQLPLHLGPGLTNGSSSSKGSTATLQSTRAGLLGQSQTSKVSQMWIESRTKRYVPSAHEPVVGIVQVRHAEGYRVDIGSSSYANVDALSFEGATKRSKPNLKVGSLLYGHLLPTPPFSEPEMACMDTATQKSAGYGPLEDGFLIRDVELSRCRSLLVPGNAILASVAKGGPFEAAVGINGRVWVKVPDGDEERMPSIISTIKGQ